MFLQACLSKGTSPFHKSCSDSNKILRFLTQWNEKLFFEARKAFDGGRIDKDPASSWYQGELGFFDHWIIPLAERLKDCCAFGVASSECFDYATQNRNEWEKKGRAEVEHMISKYKEWKESEIKDCSFV